MDTAIKANEMPIHHLAAVRVREPRIDVALKYVAMINTIAHTDMMTDAVCRNATIVESLTSIFAILMLKNKNNTYIRLNIKHKQ